MRDVQKGPRPVAIKFTINPLLLELTIPLTTKILNEICTDGVTRTAFRFKFSDSVCGMDTRHKLTALFYNTAIVFDKENCGNFAYENLEFNIGHNELIIIPKINHLDLRKVFELLQILFNKKALRKI